VAQALTLVERLVHQADLALLQVAEPAVDHLRALRRGARGEVVLLDERGAQAARGGVERHAHAGDATADDEDVEGLASRRASMPARSNDRRSAADAERRTWRRHPRCAP
jgi:hypothetical protein